MPDKPFSFYPIRRSAKPKSRGQKKAKSQAVIREEREKNLAKARRVRKKNLTAKKKAAKE